MKYEDDNIIYEVGDWVYISGSSLWNSYLNDNSPLQAKFPVVGKIIRKGWVKETWL